MSSMLIYALSHPVTDEVRYIGKSERGLVRPRQHGTLSNLRKTNLPVVRWINKLRSEGLDYVIEPIEEHRDRADLMDAERFYISYFRSLGFRLLNICDGGEGFTGRHTQEARAKIAEAGRGRKMSVEAREKISAARKKMHTPRSTQSNEKQSQTTKGIPKSLETRKRMKASWTPERRAAHAARMRRPQSSI